MAPWDTGREGAQHLAGATTNTSLSRCFLECKKKIRKKGKEKASGRNQPNASANRGLASSRSPTLRMPREAEGARGSLPGGGALPAPRGDGEGSGSGGEHPQHAGGGSEGSRGLRWPRADSVSKLGCSERCSHRPSRQIHLPWPQGLSQQPHGCPRGLRWHRGWWPGSGGVSSWGTSLGDLGLPRGPCPWVPSHARPTQSPASQPAHARFPRQSRAPRIRLIIELIKNKSFTLGEVARQSSVLVLATGKHIHSHLLINKAISMP